jgi:hypothetical protein
MSSELDGATLARVFEQRAEAMPDRRRIERRPSTQRTKRSRVA